MTQITYRATQKAIIIVFVAIVPLLLLALVGLELASAAERQGAAFEVTNADVGLEKVAGAGAVSAGRKLTYTLTISNSGTVGATNVVVSDSLPTGVSTDTWKSSVVGATCDDSGDPIVCSLGDIEAGVTEYITLVVDVDTDTLGEIVNNAEVGSDSTPVNQDSASVTVVASADLSLTKAGTPGNVFPGGRVTYTLSVVNDGPSLAANVVVSDTLPDDVISDTVEVNIGGATCDLSDNPIQCSLGDLDVDETAAITITADVKTSASGSLLNQASVTSDTPDGDQSFNQDEATTTVDSLADLHLTKAGASSVVAGQWLTYTLAMTNLGPSLAPNVRVSASS